MFSNKISKVGNTPLIKWNDIYLKIENMNPSGSIKDRPAFNMLKNLIDKQLLIKGDTVICPTSGNMGISLAYFSRLYSIKVIIVLPDNSTSERVNILKSLGAQIIFTPGLDGMKGSIKKAIELAEENKYYYFDQFSSEYNYLAHYETIKEIVNELPTVDTIICGIGTGGTYIGICKYIKENNLDIEVIGFEPINVPLVTNLIFNSNLTIDNSKDGIPGIGSTKLSNIILDNISYIDKIELVDPIVIREYWKNIILNNNIGISGAAAIYLGEKIKNSQSSKKIVAIIPDGLDRYLSDTNV